MKRMAVPALLMILMVTVPLSAGAQGGQSDDCNWSLTQVYVSLANAQVAWEVGNQAGALEALSEAQAQLERITSQCSGEEPEPGAERGGGAIVAYLGRGSSDYSKLDALAWTNGIDLRITEDPDEFMEQLHESDVVAVMYGSRTYSRRLMAPNDRVLLSVDTFVRDGGKALLFYDYSWEDSNDLLTDAFDFAVVAETLASGEGHLRFEDSMLPAWLSGMRVGMQSTEIFLNVYLVTQDGEGIQRLLTSSDSGRERMVYYESPSGRLILFPRPVRCETQDHYCDSTVHIDWFDNQNIDFFDNERAALAVLKYLLGGVVSDASMLDDERRPSQVTEADIRQVRSIQEELTSGELDEDEAESRLEAVALQIGGDGLAWILRRLPIYDDATGEWTSLEQYAADLALESDVDADSRLATDPVGVGVDLFLGDYDSGDLLEWMGLQD